MEVCHTEVVTRAIETVQSFLQSHPRISNRQAESLSNMPRSRVMRDLRNCLLLCPCEMQNLYGITNSEKIARIDFARHCQNQSVGKYEYLSRIVFSDDCIFLLNGLVNTQIVKIWGKECLL